MFVWFSLKTGRLPHEILAVDALPVSNSSLIVLFHIILKVEKSKQSVSPLLLQVMLLIAVTQER
jgi:hypothetical protein